MARHLPGHLAADLFPGPGAALAEGEKVLIVERYFAASRRIRELEGELGAGSEGAVGRGALREELWGLRAERRAWARAVEGAIAAQLSQVLREAGLGWGGWPFLFPPVKFQLEPPPLLLAVSPRERIEPKAALTLPADLGLPAVEAVEERAERLGVSALVVPLGGLGTYPSIISPAESLRWVLRSVAHEWANHIFALHPLGWKYALGLERDYEVIKMNESAADIVGEEIGDEVYRRYYPPAPPEEEAAEKRRREREAEFQRAMGQIRRVVDGLLAEGRVTEAESYMEEARRALASQGYGLRKLNQAYFAFYGSYLAGPAGAADPIAQDLKTLRRRSASLREFVQAVGSVSSYRELRRLVGPS